MSQMPDELCSCSSLKESRAAEHGLRSADLTIGQQRLTGDGSAEVAFDGCLLEGGEAAGSWNFERSDLWTQFQPRLIVTSSTGIKFL